MDLSTWGPEHWTAAAAWATVAVAVIAGVIALLHVREARRLRQEQAQPYVVAYMEPSSATPHIIDLVVRNFGMTAAYDVEVSISPSLERSIQGGEPEAVWLFDRLPVLVPGQEWRTMWDFGPSRADSDLPDRHNATVSYRDSKGRDMQPLSTVLDWTAYMGRRWVTVYGIHDAAKALREIDKRMKQWGEGFRGLSVFVRDADRIDEESRKEFEESHKGRERRTERDSDASSKGHTSDQDEVSHPADEGDAK